MKKHDRITVEEAGRVIGMRAQAIRVGLQQQRIDFGIAVQKPNGRWTYNISKVKLCEYVGITLNELEKRLIKIREKMKGGDKDAMCA